MMGGSGMMGGAGMMGGPGMMGQPGDANVAALTPDQRRRVDVVLQQSRKRSAEISERAYEQMAAMRELQWASERDSKAIADAHRKLLDVRQQSFELMLETRDRIDPILAEARSKAQSK